MQWIILDRADEGGRRLEAVRLTDGEQRTLVEHDQAIAYRADVDPTGRLVCAILAEPAPAGRSTTRCALIDLDRGAVRWLHASLDRDLHVQSARFSSDGRRVVAEVTVGAALAADIHVFGFDPDHPLDAESQALLAAAGNPERMGLRAPTFVPGGEQVFYLRRTAGDTFQIVVLDVDKPGDSAAPLKADMPSRRELVLTEPMRLAADAGLAYCAHARLLYFSYVLAGRQRLARKPLTGQPPRTFWRAHESIDCLVPDPEGAGVVYAAEGQLWWADIELDDVLSLVADAPGLGPELVKCLPGGWVLYGTHDEAGAHLHALHRPTRTDQEVWTAPGRLFGFAVVPDEEAIASRFAALPPGPLADYVPADDELKALEAAQAAEEARAREAEARAVAEAHEAAQAELRRQAEQLAAQALADEEERRAALAAREAEVEARRAERAAAKARRVEAEARAAREAEEQAAREAEERAAREAEEQAAREAEARAAREAEEQAAREAEEQAAREAEEQAAREAEERAAREAEERAAREAEELAAREAEARAAREAEEQAAREAEELAAREAEEQAAREAEARAAREAEEQAAREAEARAAREAEEQAAREAEARAAREAEERAAREAAEQAAREAAAQEAARWAAERRAARESAEARRIEEERAAREAEARRRTEEARAAREAEDARRRAAFEARQAAEEARLAAELRAVRENREIRRAADGESAPVSREPAVESEPPVAPTPDAPSHLPSPEPEPEPEPDALLHAPSPEPPTEPSPPPPRLDDDLTPPVQPAPASRPPNLSGALFADVASLAHVAGAGLLALPTLYALGALWAMAAIGMHVGRRGASLIGAVAALAGTGWWLNAGLNTPPISTDFAFGAALVSILGLLAIALGVRRR